MEFSLQLISYQRDMYVNLVMGVYFRGLLSFPSGMRGVHEQMEKARSRFDCSRRPTPQSEEFEHVEMDSAEKILGANYPASGWPMKLNLQQRSKSNSRLLFYGAPLRVKLCNHIMEVALFCCCYSFWLPVLTTTALDAKSKRPAGME